MYHDYDSLDTSPIGESTCKTWDDARLQQTLRNKKAESLDFLSTQMDKIRTARYTEESQNTALKLYRTSTGKTTHPNQGNTARAADTRDIEFGRIGLVFQISAGAVSITVGPQSQRFIKNTNRVAATTRKGLLRRLRRLGLKKSKARERRSHWGRQLGGRLLRSLTVERERGRARRWRLGRIQWTGISPLV